MKIDSNDNFATGLPRAKPWSAISAGAPSPGAAQLRLPIRKSGSHSCSKTMLKLLILHDIPSTR